MKLYSRIKDRYYSLQKTLDEIGAEGFWNRFRIATDIFYCSRFLHCSREEYLAYRFYNLKNRYRKSFYLIHHQRKHIRYINEGGFTLSKYRFYLHIPECFERNIILTPTCGKEKFITFVKGHHTVVVKPDCGSYGRDIRTLTYTNDAEIGSFYDALEENCVCEEFIQQHEDMNKLNPSTVNTIRILSLRNENKVDIISASLRIGNNKDRIVDNMRKGGIGAQVDTETGIVITYGHDYDGNRYIAHPATGCNILGYQLPNWDAAIDLVKTAHSKLPQCALLGWDIALTRTGADIIEANTAPGPLLTQFMDLIPKGKEIIELAKHNKKARIIHGQQLTRSQFRTMVKKIK